MTDIVDQPENPEQDPESLKWSRAWDALFGGTSIQVFFPDHELNARVYRLDGETGYTVKEKTVFGGKPDPEDGTLFEHTLNLNYPKKSRRGENHGRARLTAEDVIKIRVWAAEFLEKKETPPWTTKAAELNVGEGTLRDIVNRRTWIHI